MPASAPPPPPQPRSSQPERAPAIHAPTVNAVLIAVRQPANLLCDRWTLIVLLLTQAGLTRFQEFSARSGMASRLLTSRLVMLEEQEVIVRLPYMRRPLRYAYHLSHMGLALFDVFAAMARWEQDWHPSPAGTGLRISHLACGQAAVQAVPQCAACNAALAARDIRLAVRQREVEAMPTKETAYRRSTVNTSTASAGAALPLAHAIDVFGDKWGIELVMCLFTRVRNFNGFQLHLGIATNILADRLSRLTALGILRPTTDADRYGRGGYALTDKGIALFPVLMAIQAWADQWLPDRYRSPVKFRHGPCGQALRMRLACSHCGAGLTRDASRLLID